MQALRFENFEMPPKGKLPAETIAKFEQWVKEGAADPREGSGAPAIVAVIEESLRGLERRQDPPVSGAGYALLTGRGHPGG